MTLNDAKFRLDNLRGDLSHKVIHFGISGGVDSSTLAVLLHTNGFNIKGFHLVCWDEGDQCTAQDDLKDALAVSSKYNIPLDVIDLKVEYREYVIDNAIKAYNQGFVPNIDILCNEYVKFGFVADRFLKGTNDMLATGHYAMVKNIPEPYTDGRLQKTLAIPEDKNKDQTYFLAHALKRKNIAEQLFFPGGLFTKEEIRALAGELGLHNAKKPDSQGICFIGNINMRDFLVPYIVQTPGKVVDKSGNVIGEHSGAKFYAIGQRHGFTIYKYSSEPLYIVQKIVDKNLLVVGTKDEASFDEVNIKDFFGLIGLEVFQDLIKEEKLMVRFRNLGRLIKVKDFIKQGSETEFHIELFEREFGLTPGQEAVFYMDDLLIGFGYIGY